jgi:hypothetical protein
MEPLEKSGVRVLSAEDLTDSINRERVDEMLYDGMTLP